MDKDKFTQEQTGKDGPKLSRRKFLAICAGAIVLAGGGWALSRNEVVNRLAGRAMGAAQGKLPIDYLRQVIAADNEHARTIMWQSDVNLHEPAVEYRLQGESHISSVPAEHETFADDGVSVELYTAKLSGLEAGKTYEYRIKADGQQDDWHRLQTDGGGCFSALIFPDSQSNDYTDWKNLAQDAAKRNGQADFFINMGDLVDNGEDHRQWDAWFDALAGIIDRIPVAPLMGNHETYNEQWKVREPVAYLREFALPDNGSEEFARRYYSFDYGEAHFIVIDTQTDEAADFHQGLLETQQAWFREDVKKSDKKWKIVLMHKDPLQYRFTRNADRKEGFSDEGREWMPLFDEAGIDIVFSAHLHTYRNRGHIKNFQRDESGPLYILTGVAGNVRYPGLWIDHALDKVVAPQPETDNYLTLSVSKDKADIACYLPDGTEIDRETLKK